MFDIGFAELLVCLVVALVVIGPEQLPGAVRTAGLWIGRLKRSLRDTRNEIERQIGADDIRRQLHNEEVLQNIEEARIRFEKTIMDVEQFEGAATEARQQASNYGPPEELPDHAHGSEPAVGNSNPDTQSLAPPSNVTTPDNSDALTADSTPTTINQAANVPAQSGTGH